MAKRVVFHGLNTGLGTLTVKAFRREDHTSYADASRDTQRNGAAETASEETNRKGTYYTSAITDGAAGELTGIHLLQLYDSDTNWIGDWWADMDGVGSAAIPILAASSVSDMIQVAGNRESSKRFDRAARAITTGVIGVGSTTTNIVTTGLSPAASVTNQFRGLILGFDKDTATANLRGQKTDITGSTSGGVLTVTALTTAPAVGDTFTIE